MASRPPEGGAAYTPLNCGGEAPFLAAWVFAFNIVSLGGAETSRCYLCSGLAAAQCGAGTAIPERGWVGRGQYPQVGLVRGGRADLRTPLGPGWDFWHSPLKGTWGQWVVVSTRLLKHSGRPLLPSGAMRKSLTYRWAPGPANSSRR